MVAFISNYENSIQQGYQMDTYESTNKENTFIKVELTKDEAYKIISLLKNKDEKLAKKFGYKAIK